MSDRLRVKDPISAADLDRCGLYQLSIFDAEEKKEAAKLFNLAMMAAFAV